MQETLLHKIVSLMLTALLLLQFAPLGEWADSHHEEGCTHCTGAFCVRQAKGEKCDHEHGHAPAHMAGQHETGQHMEGQHTEGHAMPHAAQKGPQFCTCSHQQIPVGTLAFDKVVHPDPVAWHIAPEDDLHFVPLQTLTDPIFVDEQFRPPWLYS